MNYVFLDALQTRTRSIRHPNGSTTCGTSARTTWSSCSWATRPTWPTSGTSCACCTRRELFHLTTTVSSTLLLRLPLLHYSQRFGIGSSLCVHCSTARATEPRSRSTLRVGKCPSRRASARRANWTCSSWRPPRKPATTWSRCASRPYEYTPAIHATVQYCTRTSYTRTCITRTEYVLQCIVSLRSVRSSSDASRRSCSTKRRLGRPKTVRAVPSALC